VGNAHAGNGQTGENDRLPENEALDCKRWESEKAGERHLEEARILEEGNRVYPLRSGIDVQQLPNETDRGAAQQQSEQPARLTLLEIAEQ
jgi:hypothetical protein